MLTIVTAETEEFIEALFGPQQHASIQPLAAGYGDETFSI